MPKKKRTRQHIIADLSTNHVERHAYQCGYTVERVDSDYGTDLIMSTYNADGEIENGQVYMQLKATDNLRVLTDQDTISFPVERSDLELWLNEPMPYILIVYDATADVAYWVYVQAYFENRVGFDLTQAGKTVTIHLNKANVVDQTAIREFARYKATVLNQAREVIHHDA